MSESGDVDGERDLPAGWVWATLDELVAPGGVFTDGDWVESKDQDPDGEVRLTQLADVGDGYFRDRSNRYLTVSAADRLNCTYLEPGDVLIARMPEPLGRACLFPGSDRPAVTVVDVRVLRPGSSGLDNRWLMWAINSPQVRQQIRHYQTGTTRKRISGKNLGRIEVAVPPVAEQRRIVEALEEQLSRLDAAERAVTRAQRRRMSLVRTVRDRVVRAEGELPDGWAWRSLREVVERVEAGKSFRCEPQPAGDGEWGVIKVSAMTWGEFRQEEQKAVPAGRPIETRHEIRSGDILVSRANTPEYVGAPVLVRKTRPRLLLSDKSLRLVPAPGVSRDWLITVLSAPLVRRQISAKATGSKDSMRNISQKDLLAVRIPVPPVESQPLLANYADEFLSGIGGMARELENALVRATKMRRALLRRAFSGRLVEQDPGDTPAAEALARLAAERAAQPKPRRARKATAKPPAQRVADATAPEPTAAPALAVQQEFEL